MNTTTSLPLSGQPPVLDSLGTCCQCQCASFGKQVVVICHPCQHYFHFECLASEIDTTLTCPRGCQQLSGLQFLPPLPADWQERLCTAAANGDMNKVMSILHRGVDVNACKSGRETPLQRAICSMRFEVTKGKHYDMAKHLLRLGAADSDTIYLTALDYQKSGSHLVFTRCLELAAESGHSEAAYQLGICHLHGRYGLRKNQLMACSWLEKAAASQHGASMIVLAATYRRGGGAISRNSRKIGQLIRQAAANDYGPGLFALGYYHLTGSLPSIPKNRHQAKDLLERGLRKDVSWCLHYYCKLLDDGRDINNPEALHWIQLFANRGNALGQFMIGNICYAGRYGVSRDCAAARQWYVKSARQDNISAMVSLAVMCREGQGGQSDPELAVKLLVNVVKKSQSLTNSDKITRLTDPRALHSLYFAKAHLAEMYLLDEIPKSCPTITSTDDALMMLEEAVRAECTYALILMGKIHFRGLYSQPRDHSQAWLMFTNAVKAGYIEGCYFQALMALDHSWQRYDRVLGLTLLKKASALGVGDAQLMFAQFRELNDVIDSDCLASLPRPKFETPTGKIRLPTQPPSNSKLNHVLMALSYELSEPQTSPEQESSLCWIKPEAAPTPEAEVGVEVVEVVSVNPDSPPPTKKIRIQEVEVIAV